MNLDEIYQGLADIANSGDPAFAQAATYAAQLAQQAQSGQMSPDEMTEILRDVQRQMNIVAQMNQMALAEKLNTLINGLIKLAGAL